MWGKEQVVRLLQDKRVFVGAVSAASAGVGAGFGHLITKKALERKYTIRFEEEMDQMRAYYSAQSEAREAARMNAATKKLMDIQAAEKAIEEQQYVTEAQEDSDNVEAIKEDDDDPIVQSIWNEKARVEHENEAFLDTRDPDADIFTLLKEEYYANELDFDQQDLTYYEGDDVLVDEKDQPIPDQDMVVGEGFVTQFGVGSGDPNVVYLRNRKLGMEFEVTRSSGSYTEEVLGFTHSDHQEPKIRKFRKDF